MGTDESDGPIDRSIAVITLVTYTPNRFVVRADRRTGATNLAREPK